MTVQTKILDYFKPLSNPTTKLSTKSSQTVELIFYDTETTGFPWQQKEKFRIIELAAYAPSRPENDAWFTRLIDPECEIPEDAAAIHHITSDMLQGAKKVDEVFREFLDWAHKTGDQKLLIAHNNWGFDEIGLYYEQKRSGVKFPITFDHFDTLQLARKLLPNRRKEGMGYGLMELHRAFELRVEGEAHRAEYDVKMLYEIFEKLIGDVEMQKFAEEIKKAMKEEFKDRSLDFKVRKKNAHAKAIEVALKLIKNES